MVVDFSHHPTRQKEEKKRKKKTNQPAEIEVLNYVINPQVLNGFRVYMFCVPSVANYVGRGR